MTSMKLKFKFKLSTIENFQSRFQVAYRQPRLTPALEKALQTEFFSNVCKILNIGILKVHNAL